MHKFMQGLFNGKPKATFPLSFDETVAFGLPLNETVAFGLPLNEFMRPLKGHSHQMLFRFRLLVLVNEVDHVVLPIG